MSTTDSTGLYTSMIDEAETNATAANLELEPHPNWRWFWLGLLLAVLPLLVPYFISMWEKPTYRYFPFAIAAVAWLTYVRSDGHFYPPRGWFSWAAIGFALFLVAFGTVLQFPWFAAVALSILCAAMLYAMRGPDDENLLVVVLPLLTTVQLIRADTLLVLWLQNVTTWMSSVMLDTLAVPHAVTNNVIQLADRELFVAEACSGIQSVFTLSFLAFLMIAWRRRRIWMAPLYIAIACLLAIFANVVRVTVVALVANSYEFDLAVGWPHELLGYIALAMAFGFLLSFDYLVATLLHRVPEESEFNPLVSAWNYLSLRNVEDGGGRGTQRSVTDLLDRDSRSGAFQWAQRLVDNRIAQISFAVLAGVICLASLAQVVRSRRPANMVESDKSLVFDPPSDLIADSLNVLTVVGHKANRGYEEPRLGANSDVWECRWNEVTVQFVLSQPHQGWHELCNCYERLDWTLLDRDIRSPDEFEDFEVIAQNPDALSSTYVVARFKRGPTQHGYLIFAGIGSDGTLVDAPDSLSAFTHRVWNRIDTTGVWDQSEVIMLQMWITSPDKLKPRQLIEMQEEFIAARARIADAIVKNAGRKLPAQALRGDSPSAVSSLAASADAVTKKELK
ncbi:exosortase U [Stieleria mannarensis]|uniref:exosortase U n=1 Tax=Stieleria mannarensis TaxID=2755585 RepID=UPI001602888B|nr:exosortase U [Rhodopirellula sp. JC639]